MGTHRRRSCLASPVMHRAQLALYTAMALAVSVCSAAHYEKPPCQKDEVAFSIAGSDGSVCAPPCGSGDACPDDTPPGTTVKPRCALRDQSGKKYCALTCVFGHCPTGACVRPAGAIVGYCAYKKTTEPTVGSPTEITSSPKFMWLRTHSGNPVITFGAVAGAAADLPSDVGNARLWTRADSHYPNRTELSLQRKGNELITNQPLAPAPYVLELSYNSSSAKYYANADLATKPNDWFPIQNSARSTLDITLRDPYMEFPHATEGPADLLKPQTQDAVDQCPRGVAWHPSGDACLIAVVRFNHELISSAVNVTTYSADGQPLRTAFLPASAMGVVIVRLPVSSTNVSFASVIFREPGTGGQSAAVEHAATTSTVLQR